MATERNSETVIKVYTSNCPPADDMEYVKRSGRAQCERTESECEAEGKVKSRTALPKSLRWRVRTMRDAERAAAAGGHSAASNDGTEQLHGGANGNASDGCIEHGGQVRSARHQSCAADDGIEQVGTVRREDDAYKVRSSAHGTASYGTKHSTSAEGAAHSTKPGDTAHAAASDRSAHSGARKRSRRGSGMSRMWSGASRHRSGRRARAVSKPDYMKHMSRSTLIVCAVIMGVAAVRALPFDWAQQAVAAMSGAVNMSVDLDKTLGELKFVREVIPDSAMVFWSGGAGEYSAPFSGSVTHTFSEEQPWLEYSGQNQEVRSVRSGRVVQLEQGDAGDWAVRIEHADGMETVYAFLSDTSVQEGDSVAAAQEIGRASGANGARIYFEMRVDGKPVDPSPYLGKM